MPKLSVVLPTFNGEKFIKEAIDSVLAQTFKDWELIVVDDCSSDSTSDIIREYVDCDERIKIITNKENKKLPGSLNVGFSIARGEYYTWTSDDNILLENAFIEMVQYLDDTPACDMVCTAMLVMDDDKRVMGLHPPYDERNMHLFDVVGASFLYRSKIAEAIGEYDESLFCVEDYDYWIRILRNGGRIDYLKGCHYLYRLHDNSLTVEKREEVKKRQRALYAKHFDWVCKGIDTNENVAYLYNELRIGGYYALCDRMKELFGKYQGDVPVPLGKKMILFGAGTIGTRVAREKKEKIAFFSDSNKREDFVEGIQVLTFEEMVRLVKKNSIYHIIICSSYEKQMQMIDSLANVGINQYSLYINWDGIEGK